jgi:hypothetical protein
MVHLFRRSALAVSLASIAMVPSLTLANPVVGPADPSFYDVPASLPGKPGELIRYRPTKVNLGADAPSVQAFNVVYQSTDSLGQPDAVSGTVILPPTAWAGSGPRPVVIYAVGTHGLGHSCAPSRQFEAGTDYEAVNIVAALKAGYAVLVSDYAGYLNTQQVPFIAGKSQGHAVLDLFRASTAIPSTGISMSSKLGIWGYSQGGETAAWAGELLDSYAPELNVVGVASGGAPSDLIGAAHAFDGHVGAGVLAMIASGLSVQYPDTFGQRFSQMTSPDGKAAIGVLQGECVFPALLDNANKTLASYTTSPTQSLDDILSVPVLRDAFTAQNVGKVKLKVPLYEYQGQADELVPIEMSLALKKAYCANGTTVAFDVYPSEHMVTLGQAAPRVLAWMADRFAGKPAPNTCGTSQPDPVSTNASLGGQFIVKMDNWKLASTVHLRTLAQDLPEPDTSTFSAIVNVSAQTITGQVDIPDFSYPIRLLGIPIPTGMSIKPAAGVSGKVSLDGEGNLHVHGAVPMNIAITSFMGLPVGQCRTASPVIFPLDYDGPLAKVSTLTFTGTARFPEIKGCLLSGLLSAIVSGDGQTFTFTVSPPAPFAN